MFVLLIPLFFQSSENLSIFTVPVFTDYFSARLYGNFVQRSPILLIPPSNFLWEFENHNSNPKK
jgi:hypothetical protein